MRKIAEEKHITVSGLIRTAILSPQRWGWT
jgi:hypothetical protein